ncbi:DUF748 domain-containing protein [Kushneria phosphatilytica]|nr:DUF748 domain-containing protein [Kushneria phosphatilytica]OHV12830.1 hypothetical protein BH688_01985 [Kushneria phosphatilytica]
MTTGKHQWQRWGIGGAVIVLLLLVAAYLAAPPLLGHLITSRLSSKTGHEVTLGDVSINPFTAVITIDDFRLAGHMPDEMPLFASKRMRLDLAWSSLWHAGWHLQSVELQQPHLALVMNKQGEFNIGQLFPDTGGPPTPVHIDHLTTHDGVLSWQNHDRHPKGQVTLKQVALNIRNYDHTGSHPFQLQGTATTGDGTLQVKGQMGFSPWQATLDYQGRNIALTTFSPWLQSLMRARVTQGTLSAQGHFSGGKAANGALRLTADSASLARPVLQAPETDTVLFSANDISLGTLEFASHQGLSIKQLTLNSPMLHAVILPGMTTNLSALTPPSSDARSSSGQRQEKHDTDRSQKSEQQGSQSFRFQQVQVHEGRIRFTDRHLQQPFQLDIRQLEGEMTGLGGGGENPGRLKLDGRVNNASSISIRGQFSPLAGKLSGDLRLQAEQLPLTGFAPYIRRFGGYKVEGGTVRLDLHYRIHQGQLDADNHIILHQLDLGPEVQPGSTDLPLRKLIGLLQGENGVINLDVPVQASLDGTSLDISRIVWQAVGEAFENLLTSPVETLSAVFGDESPDQGSKSGQESNKRESTSSKGYTQGPLSKVPTGDVER